MVISKICFVVAGAISVASASSQVRLIGGYETDERDHGRPVTLIAAALGVPASLFREAFSHVTPARGSEEPEPGQVRQNKDALLSRLAKFGVTNDALDRVSNYYRYNRGRGERWPTRTAKIEVVERDGIITGFRILDRGAGYCSTPTVSVAGHPELAVRVTLAFSKDLRSNGSISSISLLKQ